MNSLVHRTGAAVLLPLAMLALGACSLTRPPAAVPAALPTQWTAPMPPPGASAALPHAGSVLALAGWWRELGDPLLVELIEAAEAASPSVTAAAARIAEARATRVGAGAALLPGLDGSLSASRGNTQSGSGGSGGGSSSTGASTSGGIPPATTLQAGLQASWEIDLFGRLRAGRDAADLRLTGAGAQWHQARVSIAADTANQYFNERACERQSAVAERDARSRAETARLTDLSMRAGFTAPADAALARASAADASGRLTLQRAQCAVSRAALVALTGLDARTLAQKLAATPAEQALPGPCAPGDAGAPPGASRGTSLDTSPGTSPVTSPVTSPGGTAGATPCRAGWTRLPAVASVPAEALAQRPDVYAAELDVAAASADVGASEAERYPRLSLSGSVGRLQIRTQGARQSLDTWSVGPVSLTLPIFDGGRRRADADAARARYDEAAARLRDSARQAVREVEDALVALDSTASRAGDADTAVQNYQVSLNATQARYDSGLASLFELEDARRTLFTAQTARVALQRERADAWVALYRAMGGGWRRDDTTASTLSSR